MKLILPFPFSFVAPGLRILQDFAGICRGNLLIWFGISSGLETQDLAGKPMGVRLPASAPSFSVNDLRPIFLLASFPLSASSCALGVADCCGSIGMSI